MFNYPPYFKLPSPEEHGFGATNFHLQWIPIWETVLGHLKNKDNVVGIEIGSLHGCSAVHCLESILTGNNTKLYCIDINQSEYLVNNLKPYQNKVEFIKGYSYDVLRSLTHNGLNKDFADYVYIDGSHLAKDVLVDSVLGFALLKPEGIMIFDDYGWGIHTNDETQKPKLGIDCFLNGFEKYYELLGGGWQVYLKKTDYHHNEEEAGANYEMNGGKI
jgi:hypothetical protein